MNQRHFLVLRLEGPLMSFGGVAVDEHGVTLAFPALSMIAGLLANALGYAHRDALLLQRLQERIRYGARRDREGTPLVDFQTVDLGQEFLTGSWTTRGVPARRGGGTAKEGTHIRYRHFLADAVFTVTVTLEPENEEPDLRTVGLALREPERPLFLGRKVCLPAGPVLVGELEARSVLEALLAAPASRRADAGDMTAWWPSDGEHAPAEGKGREIVVADERDWKNQVHVGRRFLWEAPLARSEVHSGD